MSLSFGIPLLDAVLWSIITFSLLVVLHEGGHFLAARLFGVKVHEFMVGLPGPALRWRSKRSGTFFGVTMVPLGGYVRIAGMEPGAEDELLAPALRKVTDAGRAYVADVSASLGVSLERAATLLATLVDWGAVEVLDADAYRYGALMRRAEGETGVALLARARSVTYRGRRTWQRITILAAGVAVNIVAAIAAFTLVLSVWGYYLPSLAIERVDPAFGAADAGIRAGDRIVSVEGEALTDWESLLDAVARLDPGSSAEIGFVRDGTERTASVVVSSHDGRPVLGLTAGLEQVDLTFLAALGESVGFTGTMAVAILGFFNPATFRESLAGARSVIGISEEVARAVQAGPLDYAALVAMLSLALGLMNVLPIPPLDGGKIVLEVVERFMGRPLRREVSLAFSAVGAVMLFALIGYLMYADVMRIATG
ncbi:MAG: hypothetical protein C0418_01970 [Coriobacteriaceae bacterium]|nr:hypothetical protein [Coriobacteriaceae bacterium]